MSKKETIIQGVKFTLFSASAGIIEVLSFTLLFEVLKIHYQVSYFIALVLSVLYNFTLNRTFTFKSTANVPLAMMKIGIYYAIFTPLSTWWFDPLVKLGLNEYIVLALTLLANFFSEFLVYRFVVFGKTMNTSKRAQHEAV
ncbi:MAG: GtrA family protein [Sphaerochaeta sp.]